jgi:alpha-beta hydrolase superfamily lysophospholipase
LRLALLLQQRRDGGMLAGTAERWRARSTDVAAPTLLCASTSDRTCSAVLAFSRATMSRSCSDSSCR